MICFHPRFQKVCLNKQTIPPQLEAQFFFVKENKKETKKYCSREPLEVLS